MSPDCASAWSKLDAVKYASDDEYDDAALDTLEACVSVVDWKVGGHKYPEAAGWTEITDEDLDFTLDGWCVQYIKAATCQDASSEGILTFELDDPRLDELQKR